MKRLLGSILFLAPLVVGAQVSKTSQGYTFRARFAKGQTIRWNMTGKKTQGAGGPLAITSPFTMKVLKVVDRIATVHAIAGPVMLNGKVFQKVSAADGTLDPRMKPPENSEGPTNAFSGIYPERAIKIGQSWSAPLQLGSNVGLVSNLIANYRLSGFKVIRGAQYAVLAVLISGTMEGKGQTLIRVNDGIPERMSFTLGLSYVKPGPPNSGTAMRVQFDVNRS